MSQITETLMRSMLDASVANARLITATLAAVPTGATQSWPKGGKFRGFGAFFVVYGDGVQIITPLTDTTPAEFTIPKRKHQTRPAVIHADDTGYRIYTP